MQRNVSLRRAKIQENKAKNQAVIFSVFSIVLLLVFVFAIVPLVFDLAIRFARSNGTGLTANEDTLPPQRPVLAPLPDASNQTDFKITGFTEAGAKVSLIVDGGEVNSITAGADGDFSFDQTFGEGEHEIWTVAYDEAENQSPLSDTIKIVIDKTTPSFTIDQPQDGAVFTLPRERVLTIKGKASEKATVFVNSSMISTSDTGEFETSIQLGEGKNELTLKAQDAAGNVSDEKKISVEYRP